MPVGEYEAMQRRHKQAFDNIEKIGRVAKAIWEAEAKTEAEMLDAVNDRKKAVKSTLLPVNIKICYYDHK